MSFLGRHVFLFSIFILIVMRFIDWVTQMRPQTLKLQQYKYGLCVLNVAGSVSAMKLFCISLPVSVSTNAPKNKQKSVNQRMNSWKFWSCRGNETLQSVSSFASLWLAGGLQHSVLPWWCPHAALMFGLVRPRLSIVQPPVIRGFVTKPKRAPPPPANQQNEADTPTCPNPSRQIMIQTL